MIDPRVLRDDPDRVRAAQAKRGLSADVVDRALSADGARRGSIATFEALRAEQKQLGKQIPQAQGDERAALLERTKALSAEVKAAEAAQADAEAEWRDALMSIPNLAADEAPRPTFEAALVQADEAPAGGEDDYTVLEHHGTPRDFAAEGFEPRDHIELGRMLGAIDLDRGAKVSGARFYFLTGVGAQLELARRGARGEHLARQLAEEARGALRRAPPAAHRPDPRAPRFAHDAHRARGDVLAAVRSAEDTASGACDFAVAADRFIVALGSRAGAVEGRFHRDRSHA